MMMQRNIGMSTGPIVRLTYAYLIPSDLSQTEENGTRYDTLNQRPIKTHKFQQPDQVFT